jgi:hypothetical protein
LSYRRGRHSDETIDIERPTTEIYDHLSFFNPAVSIVPTLALPRRSPWSRNLLEEPVVRKGAHREPGSFPMLRKERQRGERRFPAARCGGAVGIVKQHSGSGDESALDVVDYRLSRGLVPPVVAWFRQSRPQVVHNTVFNPARRAPTKVEANSAPCGGRTHTGSRRGSTYSESRPILGRRRSDWLFPARYIPFTHRSEWSLLGGWCLSR